MKTGGRAAAMRPTQARLRGARAVLFAVLLSAFGVLSVAYTAVVPRAAMASEVTDFRAAGCYLPLADGIVLGVNRTTNKIQLPLGRRAGDESPEQTAARETLEETGIAVRVDQLLLSLPDNRKSSDADARVLLYLCRPIGDVADYAALSPTDALEVKEVLVLDPSSLTNYDGRKITLAWRFTETRTLIRWLHKIYPYQSL